MKSKRMRGVTIWGTTDEGIGCSSSRGKESPLPKYRKKMWSRLCLREDGIRPYSHGRRKLDKMQNGNLQVNTHIGLAIGWCA